MKNFKQKICSEEHCDNIYYVRPQHFKRSIRCPECQEYHIKEKMRVRQNIKRAEERKNKI